MKENIVEFPDRGALQAEAALWLIKLDGDDEPSEEMLAALHEWLERSPVHREELCSQAVTWSRMNVLTELAVPLGRVDTAWKSFSPIAALRSVFARIGSTAVLASILLFAVGYSILALSVAFWPQPAPYLASNGTYATQVGEQKTATLADGSVVLLNTNSEIVVEYTRGFRNIRLLRGEVEFTVAKNPDMPFRVYAGNERVQALGTAFTVYLQEKKVDVTVTEGHVALATLSPPSSANTVASLLVPGSQGPTGALSLNANDYVETLSTLRAGQNARMNISVDANTSLLSAIETVEIIEEQDLARRLSWREGVLIFAGDPLEDVVREISRYTTVAIEIADPKVRAIKIGGRFQVGETDAMFDTLEDNFGLRVTRLGPDHVLVSAGDN